MDQHKPLSYQSLKTVIQYMDANFRLFRSRQITSLRKIEKVVPLRLGVLELNNSQLTFDNIDYEYQHLRECIERDGGPVITLYSEYDLNNDGDQEIFQDLMPGDIVIKDRHRRDFSHRDENFTSDSYVLCGVRTCLKNPYQFRQSHYGMKLRNTMRKKLYEVFGGKGIHQVEHLKIGVYHGVLRLPEGLKLKIRKLSTVRNSMAVIDAILPILDVSSFPLKRLSIRLDNPENPLIHSDILRTSEFLNIENMGLFANRWANLLINLPNMKIHLKNQISLNDILLLVRNWMKHPRVIGARLSMQARSVKTYLNEIEKEFKAAVEVFPESKCTSLFSCITHPMTSSSQLNIYGAKSPNYKEELKLGMGKPYMVVMEVMSIATAKPSKEQ